MFGCKWGRVIKVHVCRHAGHPSACFVGDTFEHNVVFEFVVFVQCWKRSEILDTVPMSVVGILVVTWGAGSENQGMGMGVAGDGCGRWSPIPTRPPQPFEVLPPRNSRNVRCKIWPEIGVWGNWSSLMHVFIREFHTYRGRCGHWSANYWATLPLPPPV